MDEVLIKRTDTNGDKTTVYFLVKSMYIDSEMTMDNEEYIKQISEGGFKQLGKYLMQYLVDGLQGLLKGRFK